MTSAGPPSLPSPSARWYVACARRCSVGPGGGGVVLLREPRVARRRNTRAGVAVWRRRLSDAPQPPTARFRRAGISRRLLLPQARPARVSRPPAVSPVPSAHPYRPVLLAVAPLPLPARRPLFYGDAPRRAASLPIAPRRAPLMRRRSWSASGDGPTPTGPSPPRLRAARAAGAATRLCMRLRTPARTPTRPGRRSAVGGVAAPWPGAAQHVWISARIG